MSDSQNTLYGRNELDDDYIITGAYLQGTSILSDQLELTYAGRVDKFSITDDLGFSPRAALVYKLTKTIHLEHLIFICINPDCTSVIHRFPSK